MFSATEYQYIQGLTENLYSQGYNYYFCTTNNPIGSYTSNNIYDVICYYSKDKITNENYVFSIPNNTLKCSFDSNNYSDNNTIDKLSCENVNSSSISTSSKEYTYSNIGTYSNIIQSYQNEFIFYKDSYLVLCSLLFAIIFFFLYKFSISIFRLK